MFQSVEMKLKATAQTVPVPVLTSTGKTCLTSLLDIDNDAFAAFREFIRYTR